MKKIKDEKFYLGKRGFIVQKLNHKEEELQNIRDELQITPFSSSDYGLPEKPMKVYRENSTHLYVPKSYGIEKFGSPRLNISPKGKDINISFDLTLKKEQVLPAQKVIAAYKEKGGGILSLPCGFGKCLGINTPVLMFNGSIKMVQDIQVGDLLMGDDSTPRNVLSLARGKEQMIKVIPDQGDSYIVNRSHILSLKYGSAYDKIIDLSIDDYLTNPEKESMKGYKVPIQFPKKEVQGDAYEIGYKLTDRIPFEYKCNDRSIQLELLAGIIDSRANVIHYKYEIKNKGNLEENFQKDILYVARSLGFAAFINNGSIYIYGHNLEIIPIKDTSKKIKNNIENKNILCNDIRVEELSVDEYYGFMIDGNHRFVLGDFTVTHNTILGLYFVSQLKKKAMVIVHKEFLMNQWIERIQFALPNAKIGIIQGNKCEIENNDIVIGMLQTLSMREFAKDTFDDIGHVIIDECHRIPSRVFMKALFKINCKYMLGLSATPNRKDGCTKILKWFIGDIIYSVKSSNKNIVKVDRYIVASDDEAYNQELFNFRGQAQISTMVTQIVRYIRRTKMIVNRIKEECDKNEERQFLILSDRKQQLEDFDKLLKEIGIESVGYYVGGMKKNDLKTSEKCKILLGTFPMANEGLDIPSLNALILATPKSDIIQSIGRICRVKHENIQPLIIDVVDTFSVFNRQSKKRFDVYRKNKYKIEDIRYDMDKDEIFLRKNYSFHPIEEEENSDPDPDSDSEDEVIDLNEAKTKTKTKKDNYEHLFKSMDLFS